MEVRIKTKFPCGLEHEVKFSSWLRVIDKIIDLEDIGKMGCPIHGKNCKA